MFNFKNLYLWISLSPLVSTLVLSIIIIFFFKFLPFRLPLFYSLSWGDFQLANHQQFLIIPASIALITLFNLIISWQLHYSQSFFKKTLIFSSLIISLILTITFLKIIFIYM